MVEEMAAGSGSVCGSESGRVMLIGRSWFKMAEAVGDGPAGGAPTGRPMGRTKTSPRGVPTSAAADTMVAPSLFEPGQPGPASARRDREAEASSKVAPPEVGPGRRLRLSWSLLGLVFASSLSASAITAAVILRLRPMPIAVAIPGSPTAVPAVAAPEPVIAPAIAPPPAQAPPSEPAAGPVAGEPVQSPVAGELPPPEATRPSAAPAARRARPAAERRGASARAADSPEPAPSATSTWVDPFAD